MTTRTTIATALIGALALVTAACSGGDDALDSAEQTATTDAPTPTAEEEAPAEDGTDSTSEDDPAADADADAAATDDDDTPADADRDADADEAAAALGIDPGQGPQVTMIDPGSEPRSELRFAIDTPSDETMVMSQTQTIDQRIDGTAGPTIGPLTMIFTIDLDATDAGGGLVVVSSTVTEVALGDDVDPQVATAIESDLQALTEVTTETVVDDRGRALQTTVAGDDALDPAVASVTGQLTESSQFAVPLPVEAVGGGAVWEVTQELEAGGIPLTQVSRYELLAIDGDDITMTVTGTQDVPPGTPLRDPSGSGAAVGTIAVWDSTTTGTVTISLDRLVPTSSAETGSLQEIDLAPGTGATSLVQEIGLVLDIAPG